jgi:magnesium chelatase family protein
MPSARTHSATVTGITGHVLAVTAETWPGLPVTLLHGFSATTCREQRDRVRAAVVSSGFAWPPGEVSIVARPWSLPKHGGADLAVAVAALAANGAVPPDKLETTLFYGEVTPGGQLRPVPGSVPVLQAAAGSDQFTTVVLADHDPAAALHLPGVVVITASELCRVIGWLRGGPQPTPRHVTPLARPVPDMADLHLPAAARAAAEIAAAGAHHLSLLDPSGCAAAMLACRLPHITPSLDDDAARDVAIVRSAAGLLASDEPLPRVPPLAAPPRTVSVAEMIGGGRLLSPGAASLAHHGVLFLDGAPEFDRRVRDALRQPLETGEVVITRRGITATLPARFTLVQSARPCPCGNPSASGCECTPRARRRYQARLAGPLTDNISLRVQLPVPGTFTENTCESSQAIAARVRSARIRAATRLHSTPWQLNAHVPAAYLRSAYHPDQDGAEILQRAIQAGQISDRGAAQVLRTAWTIADLSGHHRPDRDDCEIALAYQLGDIQ